MAVPYTFGTATASIPLSQLDSNFATVITLGNTAIQLGNTVTTLNNMTLANVTISSGNITLTNVSATTANVTTANVVTMIVTGNETVQGNTTVTGTITGAKLIPTGSSASGNGMYLPATNSVGISTNGTNAVYIDSSQNVGIGTSSPQAKLDVNGNISLSSNSIIGYALGSQTGTISGVTSPYYGINLGNFTGLGGLGIGVHGYSGQIFSTAGIERMRIDSSGNLLVGQSLTTTPGLSNTTNGSAFRSIGDGFFSASGTVAVYANRNTSNGAAISLRRDGTEVGTISVTTTATAYNTSSDYRLKNTVAPMTGALEKVTMLKPCTYKWNADGSDGEGFIAHELAEVCPHAVTGEKDAVNEDGSIKPQGIDTSFLVATLTAAIQEQQALITALTARIEALESKG